MSIANILSLLGGLALFLHGMQMMSSGLEAAAGNRMKGILEKLTANRVLGVVVGAVITAVIQSSSATTITGQLIALDVGALAPFFAFLGVAMMVFLKQPQLHHYGSILGGLGVLFIGMDMMSAAMVPLREMPAFVEMMTKFSNPVLGILAGAAFTALIQSSSASVGILQALANSGVIGLGSAVYVLFGQNIGTCITAVLASVGTGRNAKRTTIIHLMFNIIGTILFTTLCLVTPLLGVSLVDFVQNLTPGNPASQIANMHTLFNIVTTLLLLPLGKWMVKAAMRILPERKQDLDEGMHLAYLTPINANQDRTIGHSAIYISQLRQELNRMLAMARENVSTAFQAVLDRDPSLVAREEAVEEYIDYLNKEISQFISHVIVHETNEQDSAAVSAYFKITGNIERIGDHAMNICGYSGILKEKDVQFSEEAKGEIREMERVCREAIDAISGAVSDPVEWLSQVSALEQKMDDMTASFRRHQMERMRKGVCSDEGCILFSEMLTDFERIGDHVLNIAQERSGASLA